MESRHTESHGNQYPHVRQARASIGRALGAVPAVSASYETMSLAAAEAIAAQLRVKPDSCLGLPTGRSPVGCYQLLARWSVENGIDWSQSSCFALDDYIGAGSDEITFQNFLETNLYRFTNLPADRKFNPRFVDDYDALIASKGGLDLVVLGLGSNGHIAFNEPGTPTRSWTHCIWLTESTRQANQSYFRSGTVIPETAVTMGIATIMASRKILLIVSGEQKKQLLQTIENSSLDENIPATFLRTHPQLSILCDFPRG